jgi:hypothetical protein
MKIEKAKFIAGWALTGGASFSMPWAIWAVVHNSNSDISNFTLFISTLIPTFIICTVLCYFVGLYKWRKQTGEDSVLEDKRKYIQRYVVEGGLFVGLFWSSVTTFIRSGDTGFSLSMFLHRFIPSLIIFPIFGFFAALLSWEMEHKDKK